MHLSRWCCMANGIFLSLLFSIQQSVGQAKHFPSPSPPQAQPTTLPSIPMLDEGKGLIHLDVSVTNRSGDPVSGLNREDFALLDEDRPQNILSFHAFDGQDAPPDPPIGIVLFLDTAEMQPSDISRVQLAMEQFLRQNGGHLPQPISIFGISEDGLWTVARHDSTDGNTLATDLSSGNRILLNKHSNAVRALATIATGQRRKRGRKLLLWIGPGCARGSGIFPADTNKGQKTFDLIYWFSALFREARMSIEEISVDQEEPCGNGYKQYLSGPRTVREASDRFLYKKVLAIQSGGNVVDDTNDLVVEMNRCLAKAQTFYMLSFDPPTAAQPHEYNSLHVLVKKPGLLARTNTGYYDEPYYSDQQSPPVRRITVAQFEQQILRGFTAQQVAQRPRGSDNVFDSSEPGFSVSGGGVGQADLSKIELTDRVSGSKLSDWTARYKNRNLQQSLIAVADASAFLDPPPSEIPQQPAPDDATQQHMLAVIKSYLGTTIPKLPDFYATRTTVRYEDTPLFDGEKLTIKYQPLHVAETSKATILYRHGNEEVESQGSEPDESSNRYLITHGTFGPLLADVRRAVETQGRMKWLRWESSPGLSLAVFGFDVPMAESTDFEGGCCLPDAEGENPFRKQAGYRGEIAIDPSEGTILRLREKFDMSEYVPMNRDEILIDYGPVTIGGKTYFCPVRSISIARGRSIISLKAWDQSFLSYGPYSTKLNDMRFSNYHMFRSESRILPDFKTAN